MRGSYARIRGRWPVILLLMISIGFGPTTYAEDSAGGETEPKIKSNTVTNVFFDTPIRDALMDIATQTGTTIVPDETVQGLVTADLNQVPLYKALNIILSGGNFIFRNMGDYILVGSADPKSPVFLKLSDTKTVTLNYTPPSQAVQMLNPGLRQFAAANDETRTVNITAPGPLVNRIISELRRLDMPPDQLMLETRVVVLESIDLLNLGVQWQWPNVTAGAYYNEELSGSDWPFGIQIGYTSGREFTNALMMTLNLLEANDEAFILSNTKVMAQDGEEAEIKVTTEEYFEIITTGVYAQSDLEKIEVGTVLKITPEISGNNDVTLKISAEVSDVVARGENNLPVITRRQAASTIRVADGGTAIMGGLLDQRGSLAHEKVPGLSRLPLLGKLFQNKYSNKTSRQLAVFVTPRLVTKQSTSPQAVRPPTGGSGAAKKRIYLVGDEFKLQLMESLKRIKSGNYISETDLGTK